MGEPVSCFHQPCQFNRGQASLVNYLSAVNKAVINSISILFFFLWVEHSFENTR